ncbi:DNA-binding protein Ewg isoform X3 [Drosophila sulfurigaster albostrigata]|uniref:DNA-binding protein Ewg isoform X3 n=1 Tax=Drosophila sulfurigaster albostrigata TaxID=89887 RepID=UPI002D21B81B|nr:DNA-binding protein Ewg isoform X3 [Drosophila sulfurigaster albostrigata]
MLDDDIQSLATDDDDDELISSDGSLYDGDLNTIAVNDDVANQLAAAGPVGVAAAAAIASSKKRKRPHCFETNPSVRKRQQNRLLRKLRGIIYEFTGRVGKQAVVLVATPGKPNTSYKVFGAKPLEDVLRNLKNIVMDELDNALAQQAPPPPQEDPSLFELPGLVIDGIPTPVEKMTQAQLRAFIPLMLKYSTGRGKPGWGRESTRPPWWPKELPWANVRMDARSEDDKQKISWTHALRKIVINCYKYHGREDLLPTFADDEDKVNALISQSGDEDEDMEQLSNTPTIQTVQTVTPAVSTNSQPQQVNVVKINSAGTVITTHTAQTNTPAPTIIQSTNNQHVTTTATLPASTKIEICQAPAQQQHQQQQQQHHQQQQQQHHHHHGSNTVHIQAVTQGQPQTIQLTTASGTATATAVPTTAAAYTTQTVLSQNADGTVSLIQVDPNNPIITLPDGTTAQVQGVATLHQGEGGATIQTVQSLTDVNGHENMVDLTEAQDGQIFITTEDGQGYPVSVSNVISVPVSMYQSVMANMQHIQNSDGSTVCLAPMQVDNSSSNNNNHNTRNNSGNHSNNNNCSSSNSSSNNAASLLGISVLNASGMLNRRTASAATTVASAAAATAQPAAAAAITLQAPPMTRLFWAASGSGNSSISSSSNTFNNNNNSMLTNNNINNNNNNTIKRLLPVVAATPPTTPTTTTRRRAAAAQKRRKQPSGSKLSPCGKSGGDVAAAAAAASPASIRCVDSASLTTSSAQAQLPAKTIKVEHLE